MTKILECSKNIQKKYYKTKGKVTREKRNVVKMHKKRAQISALKNNYVNRKRRFFNCNCAKRMIYYYYAKLTRVSASM